MLSPTYPVPATAIFMVIIDGCLVYWIILLIFVVRIVTIYIRGIYMVVFERIFLYLFGERWSSSWKCSRRVLRSFSSGVYKVSVKEDVNVRLRSVSWKFFRVL